MLLAAACLSPACVGEEPRPCIPTFDFESYEDAQHWCDSVPYVPRPETCVVCAQIEAGHTGPPRTWLALAGDDCACRSDE
ncbi:MAG: hypothetical protein DRJ42_01170 [Deltaproteobacteria bacterium]|nr:MAG: hypothetical protein DRJ42_01170 [Deltaproteobacteria bacterium]